MKKQMTNLSLLVLPLLATSIALSGCTLRSQDKRTVRIQLPSTLKSASRTSATIDPSTLCFAINVTGPGIPEDPRLSCRPPEEHVGKVGGMARANTEIEVTIPSGSQRRITIWGLQSYNGTCTDIDGMLAYHDRKMHGESVVDTGNYERFDAPMELGSATTDVYEDKTVTIKADLTNPKELFQTCGGGDHGGGKPPTAAYRGLIAAPSIASMKGQVPFVNPNPAASPDPTIPTTTAGAPELIAPSPASSLTPQIPSAEIGSLRDSGDESDISATIPSIGISDKAGIGTTGGRAVVQLHWDLSGTDLSQTPQGGLYLKFRGGKDDNCTSGAPPSVILGAAVYSAAGHWIPLTLRNGTDTGSRWHRVSADQLPLPLTDLSIMKDGKRTLIVNVESGFSTSDPNCLSMVRVAYAGLSVFSTAPSNSDSHGSLWAFAAADPVGLPGSYSMPAYVAMRGSGVSIFAEGGKAPYTFSVAPYINGQPLYSSIDSHSGRLMTHASYSENLVVTVHDATGQTSTLRLFTVPNGTPIRLGVSVGSSTVDAGSCVNASTQAYTFGGVLASLGSPLNLSLKANPLEDLSASPSKYERYFNYPSGDFVMSGCTGTLSSPQIAVANTPYNFQFRGGRHGQAQLSIEHNTGDYMIWGQRSIQVDAQTNPLPAANVAMLVPPTNVGVCTQVGIYLSDAKGNFKDYNRPVQVDLTANPYGSYYTDSTCQTPISGHYSLPSSMTTTNDIHYVYYNSTAGPAPGTSIMFWGTEYQGSYFSPLSFSQNLVPSGVPVALSSNAPTSLGRYAPCTQVSVSMLDSSQSNPSGLISTLPVGFSANLRAWSDGGKLELFTDSACSTRMNGSIPADRNFYIRPRDAGATTLTIEGDVSDGTNSYRLEKSIRTVTINAL